MLRAGRVGSRLGRSAGKGANAIEGQFESQQTRAAADGEGRVEVEMAGDLVQGQDSDRDHAGQGEESMKDHEMVAWNGVGTSSSPLGRGFVEGRRGRRLPVHGETHGVRARRNKPGTEDGSEIPALPVLSGIAVPAGVQRMRSSEDSSG